MKLDEMVCLLRGAGVDEALVTLAINAWEMGAEWTRADIAEREDTKLGGIDGQNKREV